MARITAGERMAEVWRRVGAHFGRWLPWLVAVIVTVIVVVSAVWVLANAPRNPLWETTVWSGLVLTSFMGWGSLVRVAVAPRERVDIGLRAAWGMGLVAFVGAALMVPSLMTRTAAMVLVEVGLVLAVLSVFRERRVASHTARYAVRMVKREPALTLVGLVVVGMVTVRFLGAIANWHVNPYDDEIAYLQFLKKLSDTGTALEPFSFRRIAAYGGQTLFMELLSVRAAPSQAFAFDHGVAFLVTVLLVLGHRSRGRRPAVVWTLLAITLLALMQDGAINTASYFSGAAMFVALFRTLVWAHSGVAGRASWQNALPLALLSAAACSLRQNYLPVPVITLGIAYLLRIFRKDLPLRGRLMEPLLVGLLTLVLLVPWFIVSWQSGGTVLFPVMPGYANPALALTASAWNIVRELAFQTRAFVEEIRFQTLGLFVLAAALLKKRGSHEAVWAVGLGAIGGFVALSHGFTLTDAYHISRYAFGFVIAIPLSVLLTVGTLRLDAVRIGRLHGVVAVAGFAVLTQVLLSRNVLWFDFSVLYQDIEALARTAPRAPESEPPEAALYTRLQNAVPAGERIAVMTDEPYRFDYQRNPIWNIDMPCYVSPPPGMPCLQGPEALERYFAGLGIRYLIYVDGNYSRYQYRREFALELLVHQDELWRLFGPYLVDFIDTLAKISTRHRKLFSERGIVVVDMKEPS